jgi:cobalt-zinc-cadmium efflux system membrane fusion protein
MSDATILIVDDDDVLGQILTRVLTQQGYQVERATDATQALQLAREHPPKLALLDLCLPDQDGVELARQLQQQVGNLPLILMTAYPLSLREHPGRLERFAKVLTKPLNLQELRQAVDGALNGDAKPAAPKEPPAPASAPVPPEGGADAPEAPSEEVREVLLESRQPAPVSGGRRWLRWGAAALAAAALAAVGILLGAHYLNRQPPASAEASESKVDATLVTDRPDTLLVPPDVMRSVGIQTAVAHQATDRQPLELRGSLDLDANHLQRIHSRFPGEVVELGQVTEGTGEFATVPRTVRFGDRVKRGQLLAVVWSKDLGEKKSELVDALSQLRTDKEQLERLEPLLREGAVRDVDVRNQRRAVEAGLNAVARAERTLRVWRVPEEEIAALQKEAERIRERHGKRDPDKERNWARVEVVAPFDGQLVEKNATVGSIVDTTTDLFTLARLDVLTVWVHAYEEELPALLALPKDERRWMIRITSDPTAPPIPGTIDKVSPVIDPNQHTALLTGTLENPGDRLRAGQFLTATVELPPPPEVVAVPINALVEDGETSVVFIQPKEQPSRDGTAFTMRRVLVVQRRQDVALVRWIKPDWVLLSALASPQTPVNLAAATLCELPATEPGVRVVTAGALMMKATLEDLQAKQSGQ